ncbi:MAG: NADH-quinone oxidoreductase subunit A [Fidelibacterota bacterium]
MLESYVPILVIFILASFIALAILGLSHLAGPKLRSPAKLMPYESGVDPLGEARLRFSVKYFIVALMFIIFDIEIIFLYPWAVVFRRFLSTGSFIFTEMVVFLGILLFGYVFAWRKGALEWE